jgi:hypothetical protein
MEAGCAENAHKATVHFYEFESDEGVNQIASFVIEKGGLGAKERMSKNVDVGRNGHVEQEH